MRAEAKIRSSRSFRRLLQERKNRPILGRLHPTTWGLLEGEQTKRASPANSRKVQQRHHEVVTDAEESMYTIIPAVSLSNLISGPGAPGCRPHPRTAGRDTNTHTSGHFTDPRSARSRRRYRAKQSKPPRRKKDHSRINQNPLLSQHPRPWASVVRVGPSGSSPPRQRGRNHRTEIRLAARHRFSIAPMHPCAMRSCNNTCRQGCRIRGTT